MMNDLRGTAELSKLYGDPSRLRLLALLAREELTVAEVTAATRLTQSRVSTHLGRLRAAGLLEVRRAGTSTFYRLAEEGMTGEARRLWSVLHECVHDALLDEDVERLERVLAERAGTWADSVAGQMERHYSPGRTWEAAARSLAGLARLGHVLDIASGDGALAELVAPRALSVTCLDISARVVMAGQQRLGGRGNVHFEVGDMHALPFVHAAFGAVMLVNSLSYAREPQQVVSEAARVLQPGGEMVVVMLNAHEHTRVAKAYNHVQMGLSPPTLRRILTECDLQVSLCEVTSRERQSPHFEIVTAYARAGAGQRRGGPRQEARA